MRNGTARTGRQAGWGTGVRGNAGPRKVAEPARTPSGRIAAPRATSSAAREAWSRAMRAAARWRRTAAMASAENRTGARDPWEGGRKNGPREEGGVLRGSRRKHVRTGGSGSNFPWPGAAQEGLGKSGPERKRARRMHWAVRQTADDPLGDAGARGAGQARGAD